MSGLALVTMPKWGLSMEEGKITHWHRAPGEAVVAGDELIDIETSKITNSVEASASGQVLRVLAQVGQTLPCGAPLAVIGDGVTSADEIEVFLADQQIRAVQSAATTPAAAMPETREVGGHRLRFLVTGPTEGPRVVLLHGFGGDLDNWMLIEPILAQKFSVIAIDLPGHGGSSKAVGDGSATALAAAILPLIEELAPGRLHMVTHSFGAMVGRALAHILRHRVASFTAIAPADLGRVNRSYIEGFMEARRRSDLAAVLAMLFANPALASRDMAENLLRYRRLDGVDAALRAIDDANFSAAVPNPDALGLWDTLGLRGLLIWGEVDRVVPVPANLPATPHVMRDAGHMPHIERADQVGAAILAHIEKHSQP